MSSAPSRSSASAPGELAARLSAAVDEVAGALAGVDRAAPVVLIDGRSGTGKTTFAAALARRWREHTPVQVIALDDLYPGWDGLSAGSRQVCESVLEPVRAGRRGVWWRWDWSNGRRAEEHHVDPRVPLLVEGCGAFPPRASVLSDVRVWLEAPERSRRERALGRDGDAFRPYWERWARQEDAHIAAHRPAESATHRFVLP